MDVENVLILVIFTVAAIILTFVLLAYGQHISKDKEEEEKENEYGL